MPHDMERLAKQILKADIRPTRRFVRRQPIWEDALILGEKGNLFTQLTIRVHNPNFDYPDASVNLGLKNSSGSAFTSVPLADLITLRAKLDSWISKLENLWPAVEAQSQTVYQQLISSQTALAQSQSTEQLAEIIRLMKNQNGDKEQEDSDD